MTQHTVTDDQIRRAFGRRAAVSLPSDLRHLVIAAVAAEPQRWSWQARSAEVLQRSDRRYALTAMVAVVLLVVAMVAIALVGGPKPALQSSDSEVVFISNGDLYVTGPGNDAPRLVVVDLPGLLSHPTWVDAETVVVQSSPGGVYAISLITSVPRLLGEGGQLLALSPDHRRIAIGIDRPDGPNVLIVEVTSGLLIADIVVRPEFAPPQRPQIGLQEGTTGGPHSWSPDGRWLLGHGMATDESAKSGWIYRLDVQTGEIQDLLKGLCCGLHQPNPVLSPDGSRVVFVNYHQAAAGEPCDFRCGTLWSLDLARGTRTQLTPSAGSEIGPIFSPDGSWIAFLNNEAGDGFEVAVVRPDGTRLHNLTHAADPLTHAADAFAPAANMEPHRYLYWDADGRGLTFMRGPGESHELWHVTLDGLEERRVGTFLVSEFSLDAALTPAP